MNKNKNKRIIEKKYRENMNDEQKQNEEIIKKNIEKT